MRSHSPSAAALALHHVLSRNSLIVAGALAALSGLAWAWLLSDAAGTDMSHADVMNMSDAGIMDMATMPIAPNPWSAGYLVMAFAMWSIMMVAMMIPSAAPMILLHARIDRAEREGVRLMHSGLFVAAYLIVWTSFAALAVVLQALLLHSGLISAATLSIGSAPLIAALLILAAFYQLTPAKGRCLENCQSPLLFLHRYARPGGDGAFKLGVRHGLYCLGCCWALMLLLFAGGIMNLAWVALLAVVATIEKAAPSRWRIHRWIAAILLSGALIITLRPVA